MYNISSKKLLADLFRCTWSDPELEGAALETVATHPVVCTLVARLEVPGRVSGRLDWRYPYVIEIDVALLRSQHEIDLPGTFRRGKHG